MKKVLILLSLALLILVSCGKNGKKGKMNLGSDVNLSNDLDTVTYFIGILEAQQLKGKLAHFEEFKTIKPELLVKAFKKVLGGDSIAVSYEQLSKSINDFLVKKHNIAAAKNLKEGQEFLEKNKKNPNVHVLPSGLQYEVIKEGTGPKPDSSSTVTVNYIGTLTNGEKFDSSPVGQPTKFPVTQVIKGWTQTLLKMNVGSKWKIYIPAELAYGENPPRGNDKVKPNMALVFELELLSVEATPPQPTSGMPQMPQQNPRTRMQVKK